MFFNSDHFKDALLESIDQHNFDDQIINELAIAFSAVHQFSVFYGVVLGVFISTILSFLIKIDYSILKNNLARFLKIKP